MKKFFEWIRSPKSDFALFVVVLILLNLVSQRAFFRIDLTSSKSYSLSAVSRQTVSSLESPLEVKVFFSDNLPSPYNTVEQYLKDLLVEYKGAANSNFSYTFYDMSKEENEKMAGNYGVTQIQVQEVNNNEVGIKAVYMGVVLIYSDRIEVLDGISSSDGLEYRLTTAVSNMVRTTNTLAGLSDQVTMTLYLSSKLEDYGIQGLDEVQKYVSDAYNTVNKKNLGKISYRMVDPAAAEVETLSEKYGIQKLAANDCAMGIVLEYGNSFRTVPFELARSLFGYTIKGLDDLEQTITDSLQSLVSRSQEIGYVVGHDENSLTDSSSAHGSSAFSSIIKDTYTLTEINLAEENIPSRFSALIINGPKGAFSEEELYKIDQFIMKGGNVMFFLDPFSEEADYSMYQLTGQVSTQYVELDTGLDALLETYGVSLGKNYVYDKECYKQVAQGYGEYKLYWVPIIRDSNMNQSHIVSKNLGNLIFLQAGSINLLPSTTAEATVLVKSSEGSWTKSDSIMLDPRYITAPSDLASQNLAVILEGSFTSAFDGAPASQTDDGLQSDGHIPASLQPGKVFVANTSYITSIQLIDDDCSQPVAIFVRNVVDYMNGAGDLCAMRTKGLSVNSLNVKNSASATFWQIFCQYGLVVVVLVLAFILWRIRCVRRRKIRMQYDPDDSREEENIKKALSGNEKDGKEGTK